MWHLAGVNSTGSMSSESDISTDIQLNTLIKAAKRKCFSTESIKESERRRTSSSRSVTSIEMEGDNLVVVTEETGDDSIFMEDDIQAMNGDVDKSLDSMEEQYNDDSLSEEGGLLQVGAAENISMSSESTQSSPCIQRYQQMANELIRNTQAQGRISDQLSGGDYIVEEKTDLGKLKESLDLKLNLNPPRSLTPNISITDSSRRSRSGSTSSCSSTPTSGPDSLPPSPITPPFYPTGTPQLGSPFSPFSDSEPISNQQFSSPEGCGVYNNMTFPENSVNFDAICSPGGTPANGRSAKDQLCGVFSVDLG